MNREMTMQNLAMLMGRVLLAAMFFWTGYGRLMSLTSIHNYVADWGVPGALKPVLVAWEIGAGLLLLTGFHTRAAAVALAVFCVLSGFLVHLHDGDEIQLIDFMKNMALTGGFLYVAACGAGSYSLDARLKMKAAMSTAKA
jgi:putative oxidoreductase